MSFTFCLKKLAKVSGCSARGTLIEFEVNNSGTELVFKSLALLTAFQRVLEVPE